LLRVDAGNIARPLTIVQIEQSLGRGAARGEDLAQRIEEARFIVAGGV